MKLFLFLLSLPLLGQSLVIDSGSPTDQYFTGGLGDFTISYPGATGDLSLRYGTFSYHLPRQSGVYLVTLNFRETGTVSAKNQRIFSVKMNGQFVISGLDLFAVAGLASIERNFVAASNNGFIDIDFTYLVKSAIVSSITVQTLFQSSLPILTEASACQSGTRVAGAGPNPPFMPGLQVAQAATPNPNAFTWSWDCTGLFMYRFLKPDGTIDGPYVALKMPADFPPDPSIWIKQ